MARQHGVGVQVHREREHAQWNATAAKVNPAIIPGADHNMIRLLPTISMYLQRYCEYSHYMV